MFQGVTAAPFGAGTEAAQTAAEAGTRGSGEPSSSSSFLDAAFQDLAAALEALQAAAADAKLLQAYRLACCGQLPGKQNAATMDAQQQQGHSLQNPVHQGQQQQQQGTKQWTHASYEHVESVPRSELGSRSAVSSVLLGGDEGAPVCTSWVQPGLLLG